MLVFTEPQQDIAAVLHAFKVFVASHHLDQSVLICVRSHDLKQEQVTCVSKYSLELNGKLVDELNTHSTKLYDTIDEYERYSFPDEWSR